MTTFSVEGRYLYQLENARGRKARFIKTSLRQTCLQHLRDELHCQTESLIRPNIAA